MTGSLSAYVKGAPMLPVTWRLEAAVTALVEAGNIFDVIKVHPVDHLEMHRERAALYAYLHYPLDIGQQPPTCFVLPWGFARIVTDEAVARGTVEVRK